MLANPTGPSLVPLINKDYNLDHSENTNPVLWIVLIASLAFAIGGVYVFYQLSLIKESDEISDTNKTVQLHIQTTEGGEAFGSGEYQIGTQVTISALADIGYKFSQWEGSGISDRRDDTIRFRILHDTNITAHFIKEDTPLRLSNIGQKPITIRDFEGFETSQYFEDSGKKMLSLKFDHADVEKPKIGFLRMGLAFLKVRNLEILVNTDGLSANFIFSKIEELKNHKGVSYAVAEPITFWFGGDGQSIKITAQKGKLTSDGSFRLWGGVKISKKQRKETFEKLEIKIAHENKSLIFIDLKAGVVVHKISLD